MIFLTVLSLHLSPVQAAELKLYVGDPQPRNAAIQSALAPGLGQWSNEQPKKAWAVAILTMGAAGGATYLWRQSDRTFDEYERSGLKDDGLFDKHRRQRSQALIVGGVGLAAYLIGIADAYTVAKGAAPVKTSRLNVQMDQDTVGVRYAIQF